MAKNKEESSLGSRLLVIAFICGLAFLWLWPIHEKHGDVLGYLKNEAKKFVNLPTSDYLKQMRARLASPELDKPGTPEAPRIIVEDTTEKPGKNVKQMDKITNKDREELDSLINKFK